MSTDGYDYLVEFVTEETTTTITTESDIIELIDQNDKVISSAEIMVYFKYTNSGAAKTDGSLDENIISYPMTISVKEDFVKQYDKNGDKNDANGAYFNVRQITCSGEGGTGKKINPTEGTEYFDPDAFITEMNCLYTKFFAKFSLEPMTVDVNRNPIVYWSCSNSTPFAYGTFNTGAGDFPPSTSSPTIYKTYPPIVIYPFNQTKEKYEFASVEFK